MSHSCYYLVVKQRTSPRSKTCSKTKKTLKQQLTLCPALQSWGDNSRTSWVCLSILQSVLVIAASMLLHRLDSLPSSFYLDRHWHHSWDRASPLLHIVSKPRLSQMAGNKLPPTSQLTQKSLPTIYITRRGNNSSYTSLHWNQCWDGATQLHTLPDVNKVTRLPLLKSGDPSRYSQLAQWDVEHHAQSTKLMWYLQLSSDTVISGELCDRSDQQYTLYLHTTIIYPNYNPNWCPTSIPHDTVISLSVKCMATIVKASRVQGVSICTCDVPAMLLYTCNTHLCHVLLVDRNQR